MHLFKREFNALCNDPWQLAVTTYVPLFFMLCLWWIFSAAVPERLHVGVVDYDNSTMSRQLIRHLDASPAIDLISYAKTSSAQKAMQNAKVFAVVTFPHNLKRDLMTHQQPTIDIRYNSQLLLVGKLLSSEINKSLADELHHLSKIKQLLAGVSSHQANININPVRSQITPLYNSSKNYVAFLIPPMCFALLQLIAMIAFINSINYEFRHNTTATWKSLGIWKVLFCKISLYTSIMLLHGAFIYSLLYYFIGFHNNGEVFTLLIALTVMLLAVWLIVLFLFFLLKDGVRVTSIASSWLAPAFGFMGVTFPVQSMPAFAQYYRSIMPSSHYIDTHVKVANHGQSMWEMLLGLSSYIGFLILVPLIIVLVNKYFSALKDTSSKDADVEVAQ